MYTYAADIKTMYATIAADKGIKYNFRMFWVFILFDVKV